jgi:Holliday junction resolvasome RuvABC DNA-binding subunit
VLPPKCGTLFGKELFDSLISLEAVSPRYGKEIACVLTGKALEEIIKSVEKSLMSKIEGALQGKLS